MPNETLLDIIRLNVRIPDVVLGDIEAQLAACRIAERGIRELAVRYGVDGLLDLFSQLLDYSERMARQTISAIPDGTYRFTDYLDDDGVRMDSPVRIEAAVPVAGDTLTVDLEGTAPRVAGAINAHWFASQLPISRCAPSWRRTCQIMRDFFVRYGLLPRRDRF